METNNVSENKPLEEQHSPHKQQQETNFDPNSKETNSDPNSNSNSNPNLDPEPATTDTSNLESNSSKLEVNPDQDQEPEKTTDNDQDIVNIEKIQKEEPPQEPISILKSLSQEIDEYLSNLSSSQKDKKEIVAVQVAKTEDAKAEESKTEETKAEGEGNDDEKVVISIDIPLCVEKFLDVVGETIVEYENQKEKGKWTQVLEDEDLSFLEDVNRVWKLKTSLAEFMSDPNNCTLVNHIGIIHERAMSYLENEFRVLLEGYKTIKEMTDHNQHEQQEQQQQQQQQQEQEQEPEGDCCMLPEVETIDENIEQQQQDDNFLGYSNDVIANLNRIANEMIIQGYEPECCQVYTLTRKRAFDECLEKMGFQKMSIDEVQKMEWESLEREIPIWNKTFKDCATIYFTKEHDLVKAVFSNCPSSISSYLFINLLQRVIFQFLTFTEGMALTKCSSEKLFKVLDLYETLRDGIDAIDSLLPQEEEGENKLRTELKIAKGRIGEAAISIFCDLENSIKSDTGKTPVRGGAVHPLTRYTMNYLKYACEYMATLEEVFKLHSKIERIDSTSRPHFEGKSQGYYNETESQSPFSVQLKCVMDLLNSNLEAKSKLYREIGLGSIFMMNNGRYILQKIKGSAEIHQVVGDNWCRKKSSDIRNYHKSYQRDTWTNLLRCLGYEGLQVNGKVVKPVLKEKFRNFNLMFDEIHRTQSTWVVSDEQLQSELRLSITAVVIPAYRSFLGRFSHYLDSGRQSDKYIKYQPEDIETCLDELFEGHNAGAMARRRI